MDESLTTLFDLNLAEIHIHSSIDVDYRKEVEDLFFFNPKQRLVGKRVEQHVLRYGAPTLKLSEKHLSLQLKRIDHAQTLFIMMGSGRSKLVGVLIYIRESDCLKVLYLALKPAYTLTWRDTCPVICHLIEILKHIAASINGVQKLQICVTGKDATFTI